MQLQDRPTQVTPGAANAVDGAHAIFNILRDWKIDLLFTCPGSTEAAVLDASLEYPDVRVILTTHEAIAVSAADAYARVTGICTPTSGSRTASPTSPARVTRTARWLFLTA
jgi:hypothetical protein